MTYKPVKRTNELRNEVLADPDTRAIYEATKLQIDLAIQLKKARIRQKMSQNEVAAIMHTKPPAISRLESIEEDAKHSPSIFTLAKFAAAIGYKIKIDLLPLKAKRG